MTGASAVDGDFEFVLAIHDRRHGLSFWSHEDGFGTLSAATVFSEAEAASFDLGGGDNQTECLAMPDPLAAEDLP